MSFQFDLLGERLLVDSITVAIQMAQAAAGVFDIGQVRSDKPETRVAKNGKTETRKPQPTTNSPPNQTYATIKDMQDLLGKETLAQLSQVGPPPPGFERHLHIRDVIEARSKLLTEELIQLRQGFYPNHDIADVRSGTPEFKAAVDACVAYYFPPLVSPAQLLADLPKAIQEIGYRCCAASAKDGDTLAELNAWTDYFDFYSEHLAVDGAPPAPAKDHRTPQAVRQYLLVPLGMQLAS
jgi:hypothetical protein